METQIIKVDQTAERYTEKITCKKCKHVDFRELEQRKLSSNEFDDNAHLYAAIIKKYICPQCGSDKFTSIFIQGKVETDMKQNVTV